MWGGPECTRATTHHIHHRTTPTNTSDRSVCRFGDMCKSARCPCCHPDHSGTTRQPHAPPPPPRQRTLVAVSAPAEPNRAPNWEERTQHSNWAQGRPTHGCKTSPNRTHSNAQGDYEVRALQQPPPSEPSTNKPPAPSTRCLRTPQGRGLRPARWEVPRHWQQGRDQPTARGTVSVVRRREICERLGGAVG